MLTRIGARAGRLAPFDIGPGAAQVGMNEGSAQDSQDKASSRSTTAQFEYAWRWFELHARQRVSMFNFFLLSAGALANAYGILLREQFYVESAVVASMGIFVSAVAFMLDVRNYALVKMGEEALQIAEKELPIGFDILTQEKQPPAILRHASLIRSLEATAGILYLAAVIYSAFLAAGC